MGTCKSHRVWYKNITNYGRRINNLYVTVWYIKDYTIFRYIASLKTVTFSNETYDSFYKSIYKLY